MTKLVGGLLVFLTVVALGLALVTGFTASWSTPTIQEARAQSIRLEGEAKARDLQAQAALTEINAQTEAQAQGAAVTARQVAYVGLGLAVAVVAVGLALAFVTWANLRASLVWPNAAGQLPAVKVSGFGFSGYADPNRGTGVTVFKTPTAFDALADLAGRLRGRPPALPAPEVSSPLALSEPATLQLAAQASAVAMTAGATRYPEPARSASIRGAAQTFTPSPATLALPLPPVTRIEDESHIDRLLELTGEVVDVDLAEG